ncbi:type VI secretion system accessory protein TagJ [Sphingomonas immobilis]|uniref:Type VI secretion system accessory protein TagJ n=1 Tax=Sphingomonas immobilis TaxID=3063997 RepID=A0ABT9A738_9SPHN|nr:type VI secretion system accessory protein TagJ [Sphingomonas sp. CA1-15]MDO7844582.1 type VI secretion system accessory protein TagJ [Sphingomonas sp. CA1-15]
MPNADELLRAGDLDGARAALVETVRTEPANVQARMFLFQFLALAGEWDKARRQLATIAQMSGEAQMLAMAYGQAIDAEAERAQVFSGAVKARQHVESEWANGVIDAIHHFANGRISEGDDARGAAFDAAPDTPGELDGEAFEWIADADGRFGPCFEAIIAGKYGIQPFDQVETIKSEGARDLRDILWFPVQIAFKSGQSVAAMLPARYPGTELSDRIDEKLTKATSWIDQDWGQSGVGQHLWSLSTENEHGLLSLRTLSFT